MIKPPLKIHLVLHPHSKDAARVAEALFERFMEPAGSGGLRVPVQFLPARDDGGPPDLADTSTLELDAAEHSLVVILANGRMARTQGQGASGQAWQSFVRELLALAPVGDSPHHVLPVALDPGGFKIAPHAHVLHAEPVADVAEPEERQLADISYELAARAFQLLDKGRIEPLGSGRFAAPIRLFVSHAKADLRKHPDDPVRATANELVPMLGEQWFDSAEIVTGQRFDDAIRDGIADSSIVLAFQTDKFSDRSWCRREIVQAKKRGRHILVVDALNDSSSRAFPYLGNVPVVRWRQRDPGTSARRILDRAVREALLFKHNKACLRRVARSGDVILGAAPEALTLAFQNKNVEEPKTFLYPDPPLGAEELGVLRRLRPGATFQTPLLRAAEGYSFAPGARIAISVSESDDAPRYGLSTLHQATLLDEVCLYLLASGLSIAYGGALSGDFSSGVNFTLRLLELARTYSPVFERTEGGAPFAPIVNYAPWPLVLGYGDQEWDLFEDLARYVEAPVPALPWSEDEVFPVDSKGWRFLPDNPRKRYAWQRGLTEMRELATSKCRARVAIGGKLWGFSGLVSGVIEEAWSSIRHGKPLFLVGAHGGAARAVSDMLRGMERDEFSVKASQKHVPDYDAAAALFAGHGGQFETMAEIGEGLRQRAAGGLAAALNNGLHDDENRELIECTDVPRMAQLVLTGLERLE